MSEFVDCRTCKTDCVRDDGNYGYTFCDKYTPTPMTNADRIRSMSDEELCSFMSSFNVCDTRSNQECKFIFLADCQQCLMEWLQQPAEKQKEDD